MNIKSAVAEGFNVKVVKDLGWPMSSDKGMSECRWCQQSVGVFSKLKMYTGVTPDPLEMAVHDTCFQEASDYVSQFQSK